MGGFGSTRWGAHWPRNTTDPLLWLDVRTLARQGSLTPGAWSTSRWTCNGNPSGDINIEAEPGALVLKYRTKGPADADWRPVVERIPLDATSCHYGGTRPWFLCPGCGRRRAVLYSVGGRFRCQACHDLAYSSTREEPWDRATRRADKLRRQIGAQPGYSSFAPKPKGMHWDTYERIVREMQEKDRAALMMLIADTDRLRRDIERRF